MYFRGSKRPPPDAQYHVHWPLRAWGNRFRRLARVLPQDQAAVHRKRASEDLRWQGVQGCVRDNASNGLHWNLISQLAENSIYSVARARISPSSSSVSRAIPMIAGFQKRLPRRCVSVQKSFFNEKFIIWLFCYWDLAFPGLLRHHLLSLLSISEMEHDWTDLQRGHVQGQLSNGQILFIKYILLLKLINDKAYNIIFD